MASTSAGLAVQARRSRPPELQDPLNRLVYHPLALRLARLLQPTGISPNAVSIAGALLVWGAAAAYVGLAWPASFLLGFTLHLLWHVTDGADGDLARLTGRTSATGELIDGLCDYAGHIPLYVALAAFLQGQIGIWAWVLASAAGASHLVQSNHSESQRRFYLWWVYRVPWIEQATEGDAVFAGRSRLSRLFAGPTRFYLAVVAWMTPFAAQIDAAVDRAEGEPERERIGRIVRESSGGMLVFQKLLGPNLRTILLGLSMALGTPLYFFLAEAVLLNLLLAVSVRHHNAAGARMVAAIG